MTDGILDFIELLSCKDGIYNPGYRGQNPDDPELSRRRCSVSRIVRAPHITSHQLNNINKTAYYDLYNLHSQRNAIETTTYLAPNHRQTLKHTLLHALIQASSTGLAWPFHAYQP